MADNREIHHERRKRLFDLLKRGWLSAMLVSSGVNVRYLANIECSFGHLVCVKDKTYLITDGRYAADARANAAGVEVVEYRGTDGETVGGLVKEILSGHRIRKTGYEPGALTVREFDILRKNAPGINFADAASPVEELRTIKDAGEIKLIRRACAKTDRAFRSILEKIRPGMTERELRMELDRELIAQEIEKTAFDSIVASGPNGAFAHAKSSGRKIRRGDFIVMDFGVRVGGYHSDMTRTVYIGSPSREDLRRYNAVNDARKRAFDIAADGMLASDLDGAARAELAHHGLAELFIHGLGHGVGLEVHESPRLTRISKQRLAPGMVFTIEPGIYREGWGGIRIEDTCALTADGPATLTKSKRSLVSI